MSTPTDVFAPAPADEATRTPAGEAVPAPADVAVDLMDPRVLNDPYRTFARLREQAPLVLGRYPWGEPFWMATRYADVKAVLSDPDLVTNPRNVPGMDLPHLYAQALDEAGFPRRYARYLLDSVLYQDGHDHTRLRKVSARAFTARRVAHLRPTMEAMVDALVRTLAERAGDGAVDLLEHFAYPLSIATICEIAGVPEAEREQWRAWSSAFYTMDPALLEPAVRGMADRLHTMIEQRRAEPTGDLLTGLAQAVGDGGERLTDEEIVTLVLAFITAGNEATAQLIGNGVAALLTHPDQLALLRSEPGLLPRAVHEMMRWCGPAQITQPRYATRDLTVGGMPVRKGEQVMAVIAAAGHDPEVFPAPERFDITREPGPRRDTHVGFGFGPHYCLGAALALQEAEAAIGALLRHFPDLALAVAPSDLERQLFPGSWRLRALPLRPGRAAEPREKDLARAD
ncbi:cytochrome P450 family protein [Streptomyces sp. URMC 123]|uniref:cytochrome P450 family protein n=1 Tax=Streptomyces sp. URMC 123 TaxID=3423403 RepID=UPI003F1E45E2